MPAHRYRQYLRSIRPLLGPEHEAVLCGQKISDLRMADLEALYELVIGRAPCRS